jgi:hypothetical protein
LVGDGLAVFDELVVVVVEDVLLTVVEVAFEFDVMLVL